MTNSSGKREKTIVNSVTLYSLGVTEIIGHDAYKMNLYDIHKFMFPQCFSKTNHEITTEVIISNPSTWLNKTQNRDDSKASLICFTTKFTIGKENRK